MVAQVKTKFSDIEKFPKHIQQSILRKLQEQGVTPNNNIPNMNMNMRRVRRQTNSVPTMIFIAVCVILIMSMFGLSHHTGNGSSSSYRTQLIK